MSIISESEDIATMTINYYERILRERDELAALLAAEKATRNLIIEKAVKTERERDEAREELENVKLQLRLWEDGNIICEETLGEIRLLNEQINGAFRERNEAHKIAERAIDDLACFNWFNYSNAQRLRSELNQLKECAK